VRTASRTTSARSPQKNWLAASAAHMPYGSGHCGVELELLRCSCDCKQRLVAQPPGRYASLMTDLKNTLELLGKRVRCQGKEGLVVSTFRPLAAHRDGVTSLRTESVTIRFRGEFGSAFVEVAAPDLGGIEILEG